MPVVVIPTAFRTYSDGRDRVTVEGRTLRQVFAALDVACPGLGAQLVEDDRVRPQLAVAIDGAVVEGGLFQEVPETAEVFLIPAIGGGARLVPPGLEAPCA